MQSTQEIAELMLDSGRNALLALDIKVSIATLGVGTGALIAGFFGMNVSLSSCIRSGRKLTVQLSTHLEETEYAFLAVSGGATFLAFLVFLWGARILRKVRRVALSGRAAPSLRLLAIPMRRPSPTSWTPSTRRLLSRPAGLQIVQPSIFDRIFRRRATRNLEAIQTSDPRDPVWINEKADQARARDAFMAGWTGKSPSKDYEEVRKALKEFDEDWKAGPCKTRWAKD